ncbi:hypothetical protein GCM10009738_65110 [Kitasatospora viridis]
MPGYIPFQWNGEKGVRATRKVKAGAAAVEGSPPPADRTGLVITALPGSAPSPPGPDRTAGHFCQPTLV